MVLAPGTPVRWGAMKPPQAFIVSQRAEGWIPAAEDYDDPATGGLPSRSPSGSSSRGHRWLAMVKSGMFKSLKEIAKREGVDTSYGSRMVNLTALAPDIVVAILDGPLTSDLTLFDLAVDPPPL